MFMKTALKANWLANLDKNKQHWCDHFSSSGPLSNPTNCLLRGEEEEGGRGRGKEVGAREV